jgi:uncharacterized membrane protein YdbT with pleckstrin-like domain
MLNYTSGILAPDERILYAATLHWIVYLSGLFFVVVGGLFGYFTPQVADFLFGDVSGEHLRKPLALLGMCIVLMGLALLMGAYIRVASTELVVTNTRVVAKYGFVSRATFEIMLNRVTGVNFDQTITGRILGFGTVIVRGAGGDISPIDAVADPQTFHNQLMTAVEKMRTG